MLSLTNVNNNEKLEEKKLKYLGGIIKRVNNFNFETTDERHIFHKTVYLIQAFGFYLGYNFSWQNCGVYSPQLTKIGYLLKDKINEIPVSKFTDPATEEKFKTFVEFIEPFKNNLEMLRIVSGLHLVQKMNPDFEKKVIEIFLADNTNIELNKIPEGWKLLEKLE